MLCIVALCCRLASAIGWFESCRIGNQYVFEGPEGGSYHSTAERNRCSPKGDEFMCVSGGSLSLVAMYAPQANFPYRGFRRCWESTNGRCHREDSVCKAPAPENWTIITHA